MVFQKIFLVGGKGEGGAKNKSPDNNKGMKNYPVCKEFKYLESLFNQLQEELSSLVIETYVEELIKDKQYNLIAFYVSKLPSSAQVHWYAKFLEGNNHPFKLDLLY